jgi:hypothetical protein
VLFFVSQVGACETSPNQLLLAWTEDTVGGEKYTLHVKVRCRLPLLCVQCHCTMGSVESSKTYMCCRGCGRQYYCAMRGGGGVGKGLGGQHECAVLTVLMCATGWSCWLDASDTAAGMAWIMVFNSQNLCPGAGA